MQRIIKSNNPIADLATIISEIRHDRLFVLTDEHTARLCLPLIESLPVIQEAGQIVIPPNDTGKTPKTWRGYGVTLPATGPRAIRC